jgi:hypothetical protein
LVEEPRGPAHDVLVAAGHRVERAGVDDLEHGGRKRGAPAHCAGPGRAKR